MSPTAPAPAPAPPPSAAPAAPGEPIPPTPLGKPLIDVSVPDPGPAPARTYHVHDGFYFRANVGALYGATEVSSDRSTHRDYEANGFGIAVDLMAGGSPSPGVTLGGGLSFSGYGGDGSSGLGIAGVFVDGFPDASGGWHLGGLLGVGYLTANDDADKFQGAGFGLSAWVGHGFWIADDWSFGPLLRFNGVIARDASEEDAPDPFVLSGAAFEGALMFSVLYH
ncbi:MAG TPA: hypothetical protein VGK73_28980 [Polyangiaceae bacterium]